MFEDLFDGRKEGSITAKHNMQTLDYGMLYNGDVVLMECQIRRYRVDRSQTSWATFRTNFHLAKITLMWNATNNVPEVIESPPDDEREVSTDDDAVEAF